MLTTHLRLVPRSRIRGSIHPLPHTSYGVVLNQLSTGATLPFNLPLHKPSQFNRENFKKHIKRILSFHGCGCSDCGLQDRVSVLSSRWKLPEEHAAETSVSTCKTESQHRGLHYEVSKRRKTELWKMKRAMFERQINPLKPSG
jgi:hypothetical protein